MPEANNRTVSLPREHADFIDAQVASGAYESASDVVRAGLQALQERDTAVEHWLREEVAPAYDAMRVGPDRALSESDVFDAIRDRHEARLKGGA